MHIRLLAVGDRQPAWVDQAFDEYATRLPRQWRFRCQAVATATRRKSGASDAAVKAESDRILGQISPSDYVILLDERGQQFSSRELAERLGIWQGLGRDLSFVIGGPDGVSADCAARSDLAWSLSRLTLPHGLARVMFAEQLYRAWTINNGHPYHRD